MALEWYLDWADETKQPTVKPLEMNDWQTTNETPPKNRPLIAYCPKWCFSGYQICYWDGKKYSYDEQLNNMFNENVEAWSLFVRKN